MKPGRIWRTVSLLSGLALALTGMIRPGSVRAEAVTNTEVITIPYATVFPNPCTGEPVTLEGEHKLIVHSTVDEQGGVHGHFSLVPQGIQGVSATGTRYMYVDGNRFTTYVQSDGAPSVFANTHTFNMVSQGSEDNFFVHFTFIITINNNYEVTAEVFEVTFGCFGSQSPPL